MNKSSKKGTEPEKAKKTAAKPAAKKAAGKASAKGKKGPKPEEALGIRKTAAELRTVQEENSIAPPSQNLKSAFDLFKQKKRPAASTPTVTRLAAGSAFPRPKSATPPAAQPAQPAAGPAPAVKPAPAPAPALQPPPAAAPKPPAPVSGPASAPPPAKPVTPPAAPKPQLPPVAPARPQGTAPFSPQRPSQPAQPGRYQPPRPGGSPPYRPGPGPRHPGSARSGHKPQGQAPAHRPAPAPAKPVEASASSPQAKSSLKKLQVSSMITVRELAEKMEAKPNDLIKKLMGLGVFATINQRLDTEVAELVSQEFGYELEVVAMYKEEELQVSKTQGDTPEKLKPRSPIVTVMGHVDHGKTSLLDAIREARVAEGEAGGITQHIGAYKVGTPKGEIVFLDTPGHQAFTAMRARGAKVTDIVVLVVSAVDGIMPQTLEAVDHAKAAGVPLVVAVNKIDLPGANPQKIRQDLAGHGLNPEEWGGKTIYVDVSAKKRLNLDKLLEMILLQSEVLEIKANPDRPGHGVILEAKLDAKRGSAATLLVQAGTVRVGDPFVAGLCHGKIKALIDDRGQRIELAGPSTPVELLGLIGTPQAGDIFSVVTDEKQAREIAEKRRLLHREQAFAHQRHMTLVGLKSQATGAKDLNIVLKADAQGSLQALHDSLEGISTSECRVRIIHSGVGVVNESDVLLASASDAVTLLFHTGIEPRAQDLAAREGVEIRKYEIIYDLIADVRAALEGLLEPEVVDVVVGRGEVREVFGVRNGKVAGCYVREGKVVRGGMVRLIREGQVVHEGKIGSLKRFKDDAKEVEKGLECGLMMEGFQGYQKGDQLEFIVKETRTRRLESQPKA
ncbi:MAG: translation initiation factor IF-2 [Elusimicrobia bacterium]|nr:translation initiation factor IF-2 [Elusimicrobiota bacterium]